MDGMKHVQVAVKNVKVKRGIILLHAGNIAVLGGQVRDVLVARYNMIILLQELSGQASFASDRTIMDRLGQFGHLTACSGITGCPPGGGQAEGAAHMGAACRCGASSHLHLKHPDFLP